MRSAAGVSSAYRSPAADASRRRHPARAACSHLAASDPGAGEPAAVARAAVREGLRLESQSVPERGLWWRRRWRWRVRRRRRRRRRRVRWRRERLGRGADAALSGRRAARGVRDLRGRRALGGAGERAADRARPDAHSARERVLRAARRHRHRPPAPRPARHRVALPRSRILPGHRSGTCTCLSCRSSRTTQHSSIFSHNNQYENARRLLYSI